MTGLVIICANQFALRKSTRSIYYHKTHQTYEHNFEVYFPQLIAVVRSLVSLWRHSRHRYLDSRQTRTRVIRGRIFVLSGRREREAGPVFKPALCDIKATVPSRQHRPAEPVNALDSFKVPDSDVGKPLSLCLSAAAAAIVFGVERRTVDDHDRPDA